MPSTDDTAPRITRRGFLRCGAVLGAACLPADVYDLLSGTPGVEAAARATHAASGSTRVIRTGCPSHNCGGRCLLKITVSEGRIVRIESDDRPGDAVEAPQLRACIRGRAYRQRQYHKDRLLHPLKRTGKRGEGSFERVGWDEALDEFASRLKQVKEKFGNEALFLPYGTGSYNQTNGRQVAERLLNLFGGSLGHYNNYSWAAMARATPTVYGTNVTGNGRQDWLNARYILMWGWNPSETRDGTNTELYLRMARDKGARLVCVDPRMTMSAVALADEWVPIRPGTDVAMMSAMAHVLIEDDLVDREFVDRCSVGFDGRHMPPGAEGEESYSDYILGTRDKVPKTPAWAEKITGVPRGTVERIAREYGTRKPGVLYQGYGMQRRAYGEQVVRAGCVLAALTGNVGIPGGWAGGMGYQAPDGGPVWTVFPAGTNPVKAAIPTFLWTEAVVRAAELGPEQGLRGAERLRANIKLIYSVASNVLVNQHANINRTAKILRDESLVEFIVVQDNFLTPSARFADLVLPACTQFETWGVEDGWKYGDEVLLMPKVVEPPGETKSDYAIAAALAARLGLEEAYTEGRSEREWTEWCLDALRKARYPALPGLSEFYASNSGVHLAPVTSPAVALADFRRDPAKHPLATPSGRIEIYSTRLRELDMPDEVPPIPKYIQEWESPFGPEAGECPLQLIGHHALSRVHSTMHGVEWLEEAFPQRVFINPMDAGTRGLRTGDLVKVFNSRGETRLPCRVTRRVMPGVVAIPQGAWWMPDDNGIDLGGSVNVLTSERWTPLAFGNAQHTTMVEVEKA